MARNSSLPSSGEDSRSPRERNNYYYQQTMGKVKAHYKSMQAASRDGS